MTTGERQRCRRQSATPSAERSSPPTLKLSDVHRPDSLDKAAGSVYKPIRCAFSGVLTHVSRQILRMMEAFKEGKTLNIRYAWPLIKQAKEIFAKEATIQVSERLFAPRTAVSCEQLYTARKVRHS